MKSSELGKEVIKKELPLIPKSPGVYRMLNHKDDILYVGKAKNLPNRLKSYVNEKNHIIRTERMLSQTFKIEITTTANESEALLLEANLIKKHKPKFNILLKDDKSFPFIFIGEKEQWPRVIKHRGKKEKSQKVKFSLEIDYEDKKPTNDKDIKSIVNYGQVVKLIKKLTKNKHYNFLETLAEDVFDVLFKDRRIGKIMLQIEKLEILKDCTSVGIQITKKRSYEKL